MRVHSVKKARVDYWKKGQDGQPDTILIAKGEPYFWWKFRNQDRVISKTRPTKDQLRKYPKPEFQVNMESYQNRREDAVEEDREELLQEVQDYKGELQEKLDNMPQQLQESSILNEYIEQLEELEGELENEYE